MIRGRKLIDEIEQQEINLVYLYAYTESVHQTH